MQKAASQNQETTHQQHAVNQPEAAVEQATQPVQTTRQTGEQVRCDVFGAGVGHGASAHFVCGVGGILSVPCVWMSFYDRLLATERKLYLASSHSKDANRICKYRTCSLMYGWLNLLMR